MELTYGCLNAVELTNVDRFLQQFIILWPKENELNIALGYVSLKLSIGIGIIDSLTAALSVGNNMPLLTFNKRHFDAVPGLRTIQPYKR